MLNWDRYIRIFFMEIIAVLFLKKHQFYCEVQKTKKKPMQMHRLLFTIQYGLFDAY